MELVQTGSGQYTEKVRTGLQPMRMKEKCINEIGSDWIWPIFRRSGNRLETNENEGEMHSKTELVQLDVANFKKKWKQACNQ